MIRESFESFTLAFLSSLAIRHVEKCELVVFFVRDRGCDARVHATGDETDSESWSIVSDGCRFEFFSLDISRTAHYISLTWIQSVPPAVAGGYAVGTDCIQQWIVAHYTPLTSGPQMY